MKKQKKQKVGKIAFIILFCIIILIGIFFNIDNFFLEGILNNFLKMSFFMFLYAVIPCLPAVILRVKFRKYTVKWIAIFASIIVVLCCIIMLIDIKTMVTDEETMVTYEKSFVQIDDYKWLTYFAQYALTSSAPVLYCIAFYGRREIWVALVPSLIYFLNMFINQAIIEGFTEILVSIFSPFLFGALFQSAIFAVWALIYIFIAFMIHKYFNRKKI